MLEAGGVEIKRLDPMLEGQVAVLSSGLLSPEAGSDLLDRLRASPLYCPRRNSYLLYPDREAVPFMDKNRVEPAAIAGIAPLEAMLARGDHRILIPDTRAGCLRFHPACRNHAALHARLAALRAEGACAGLDDAAEARIADLYESVFHHHAFTGRSGSMFAYEGLGSIYWHMVAKLLLAVQETLQRAVREGAPPAVCAMLDARYAAIRDGLGFRKTAREYGAFPTDPYSHTPAHAGAQQPGMTGQVKEEILTRRGELGVQVQDGTLSFRQLHRLLEAEFATEEGDFEYLTADGRTASLPVPEGCYAFTVCQTPVLCRRAPAGTPPSIRVQRSDGREERIPGNALPREWSGAVFGRDGSVRLIEVALPPAPLAPVPSGTVVP